MDRGCLKAACTMCRQASRNDVIDSTRMAHCRGSNSASSAAPVAPLGAAGPAPSGALSGPLSPNAVGDSTSVRRVRRRHLQRHALVEQLAGYEPSYVTRHRSPPKTVLNVRAPDIKAVQLQRSLMQAADEIYSPVENDRRIEPSKRCLSFYSRG